ncbi:MAG TPA: fibronectin type III domain-containing protein [Acidimicrobiales bacterium]|nr:fibronectin type III domain-containing protein [Acidimicrobiales bacterium]
MATVAVVVAVVALAAARPVPAPAATGPAFVQQVSVHGLGTSKTLTPAANITAGNRMVVEVGIWNSSAATASSVTDSAGNTYTLLLRFKASENTEMTVWSAPITAGGGTRPTITVRPTSSADIGAVALEYAGLASDAGTAVLDQSARATSTTGGSAATVSSGATPATTADNGLALGFYADSGFGKTLSGVAGFAVRANMSPASDMEMLVEDAVVPAGARPNAGAGTGANTTWLMATLVLKAGVSGPATAPGAPSAVTASPADGAASVTWTAPSNGGGTITSYTVTPYVGTTAQAPVPVTGSPPPTTTTVGGLTNGTAYTFTVSATNAVGTGPASAPSNAVTPSVLPGGQWSPLVTLPDVALHNVLLPSGRLLQWDGWEQPQPTFVWDPATQTSTTTDAPDSIFCAGVAQLPDGRVLSVGGWGALTTGQIGIVDTTIFNPATGTWSRVANMHLPRWYPDLTELADGRYVAISGNSKDAGTWADTPEVYNPATNTWTLLSSVSTSQVHEEEYPFSYLLPNGKVFTIGPSEDLSFQLDVANQTWTPTGGPSGVRNGSSVMYRPGKILYSGGAADILSAPAQKNGAVIDLTAPAPAWQPTAPMANSRIYHTLTMMADGKVLAVGGAPSGDQNTVTTGVLPAEIWDPATGTWTTVASITAARNYHSTAILMPDGRILVAGGGHQTGTGDKGQFTAQYYSPPYLSGGARPTITSAPASTSYGSTIPISTPDAASIASVNLVSLGADTHQSDMSQHFVPLSFTAGSGTLTVTAPGSAGLAPPGNYMVFIVNGAGVPSVASMISIGQAATPTVPGAPTSVAATPGDGAATVTWAAPADGGSPISSYTVTPYAGASALTPTVVTGSPPAPAATIGGLTNGTTYTFTVSATNAVGAGAASAPSNAVTPAAPPAPTVPGAPTAVAAAPANGAATVSWAAPADGGSPVSSYTVTPYVGAAAQTPTVVSGSPPATSTTVGGLVNGTTYTFTVSATNAVGTGAASAPSNAVVPAAAALPAFVQQATVHGKGSSKTLTPAANITNGNRMIVEVGVWSSSRATAASVTDSAGNAYTVLSRLKASDRTELSVWSAPITAGGGTRPVITVRPTSTADVGAVALEYSGLSAAAGTAVLDQSAKATSTTGAGAATVSSGATPPTTADNELALGFYADSGFGRTLAGGPGFSVRANMSPTSDMEMLAEDAVVAAGATPNAGAGTGPNTTWLMATLVFKTGVTLSAAVARSPASLSLGRSTTVGTSADGTRRFAYGCVLPGSSPAPAPERSDLA